MRLLRLPAVENRLVKRLAAAAQSASIAGMLAIGSPFAAGTAAGAAAGTAAESGDAVARGDAARCESGSPDCPPAPAPSAVPARVSRYALPLLGAYRKTMEIEDEIHAACDRYRVPRPLARAVCMYESGGDDRLTSGAGARGYFQVMPSTFRLMKVATNIEAGVKYLGSLLNEFGREDDALAGYNGGPTGVKKGRPMPVESLQYVVGVGIYRTLLTREEPAIREEASQLDLLRVTEGQSWESIASKTGVPVLDLRLYNPYLSARPLKPGARITYPRPGTFLFVADEMREKAGVLYDTRRGDNYLLLAFAFDVDLDLFRSENQLWRVQAPFEGMRLSFSPRPAKAEPLPDLTAVVAGPRAATSAAGDDPDGPSAVAPSTSPYTEALSPVRSREPIRHKVRRGDTLRGIATRYGVTIDSIRKANSIQRSRIKVGQVLRIPED